MAKAPFREPELSWMVAQQEVIAHHQIQPESHEEEHVADGPKAEITDEDAEDYKGAKLDPEGE